MIDDLLGIYIAYDVGVMAKGLEKLFLIRNSHHGGAGLIRTIICYVAVHLASSPQTRLEKHSGWTGRDNKGSRNAVVSEMAVITVAHGKVEYLGLIAPLHYIKNYYILKRSI